MCAFYRVSDATSELMLTRAGFGFATGLGLTGL